MESRRDQLVAEIEERDGVLAALDECLAQKDCPILTRIKERIGKDRAVRANILTHIEASIAAAAVQEQVQETAAQEEVTAIDGSELPADVKDLLKEQFID